jgi:polyribonucleotide nucleotidyltransferase
MSQVHEATIPFGAENLMLETGRLAKQADGAVLATVGGTVLLVAVTVSPEPKPSADFFPLMVDYREKFYASGRIPGGFFKREGRPSDAETLKARLIDRAIRPLFPEGLHNEVMVYVTVVASDNKNPADVGAFNAASAALQISSVPFPTSTAAVRVGRVGGQFVLNPTFDQTKESELELIVAGTRGAINMVESGAKEVDETTMIAALKFAHENIVKILDGLAPFVAAATKTKFSFEVAQLPDEIAAKVTAEADRICDELVHAGLDKTGFQKGETDLLAAVKAPYVESNPELLLLIKEKAESRLSRAVRKLIIDEGRRVDGRERTQIRPISCDVPVLPAVHGSAVFTRGQTQALGVVTLGTIGESQMMDTILGTWDKHFLLHYNFPPYSVGEAKPMRAPGRREIGHGALAERALEPVMPVKDDFPYTVRLVSEILESNGSSSMATVCVGSLALMDAGVPIKRPVAGIAMGLVANDEGKMAVLTDIQGVEDHLGDMDFKVAGTREGITALQMDIKIEGVTFEIMEQALHQAKTARLEILDKMALVIAEPRAEMAESAPRVTMVQIPVDKIGALIGPGGKNIRGIQERTGAKIDVEDDGKVYISSADAAAAKTAEVEVRNLTMEIAIGQVYEGKVVRIEDFGAFIELLPGRDGMVHVSELAIERVPSVQDVLSMGDMVKVKVVNVDPTGKVRLSRKAILMEEQGLEYIPEPPRGGGGRGGDRGGRGGDRGGRGGGGDRGGSRGGDHGDRGGHGGGGGGGHGDRAGHGGGHGGGFADRPADSERSGGDRGGHGGGQPQRPREDAGPPPEYGFRERPRAKE